jgi:hypothetical protein
MREVNCRAMLNKCDGLIHRVYKKGLLLRSLPQPLRSRIRKFPGKSSIKIIGAFGKKFLFNASKKVIGVLEDFLGDRNPLLRVQLVHKALDILRRRDLVGLSMDDQPR